MGNAGGMGGMGMMGGPMGMPHSAMGGMGFGTAAKK